MAKIHCPSCGSDYIRRSRRKNIWERLISIFGVKPYFCDDCAFRFFSRALKKRKTLKTDSSLNPRGGRKRFAPWWMLVGLLVLAIGAAWWVFSPGAIQTSESTAKAGKKVGKTTLAAQATPSTIPRRKIVTTSTASTMTTTTSTITTTTRIITPKPPAAAPVKSEADKKPKPGGAPNIRKKRRAPAASPKAKAYSVQFGAFKSPDRAGNLVKGLGKKGVKARVDKISDSKGAILYKVRVGGYKKHSDALAAIKRLRRKTGLECFVARVQ